MKTKFQFAAFALAFLSTINSQLSTLHAQGALTPPGAPAPTMKTLDQIEARTPISFAPYTISQPGSYYLTTNLTVNGGQCVVINANQVTLDLNGFTIASTAAVASGYGISLGASGGNTDVTILNGHIKGGVTNNGAGVFAGPGFYSGIDWPSTPPQNVRVTGVTVSGCQNGIFLNLGGSMVIESCTVKSIGQYGIYADNIAHCTATTCGQVGIYGVVVTDCHSDAVTTGSAITANIANNCYGFSPGGTALNISGGVAIGCIGQTSASGTAIAAKIANSCVIVGGLTNITYKYNMP